MNYKIPLRELNWKMVIRKIIKAWIHLICITCCLCCAIFMCIITWSFLIPPHGIILWEFNIFIAIIEVIATFIAVHYCLYLLIKVFKK
jgi:hypothetical protein